VQGVSFFFCQIPTKMVPMGELIGQKYGAYTYKKYKKLIKASTTHYFRASSE
jgi:hypothetical protein